MDALSLRIHNRSAVIGIIGLGYVGLPLAVEFLRNGFPVMGLDVDPRVVSDLNAGRSHIPDVEATVVQSYIAQGRFRVTSDFDALTRVDCACICVPTPLGKTRDPDISYVLQAANEVARHLHPGQLVVLESTVYPGATEDVLLPLFETGGMRVGRDFYLAFSPERVDPGNPDFQIANTPKVVGGVTPECTAVACDLYAAITRSVVPVSSPKAAELSKLLENTFRLVNVALVNELAQVADILGVNVWEIIDAASTKPFGFMRFQPGPGLGGHCIPVDPQYLAWKLRSLNSESRFIDVAARVNGEMPGFVVEQVTLALNEQGKCLNGARVLILGVAYKRDVGDIRESPAIDIAEMLQGRLARVSYSDEHVATLSLTYGMLEHVPLSREVLGAADCVVVVTDHSDVDYASVVANAQLVIDTRNALGQFGPRANVWPLVRPARGTPLNGDEANVRAPGPSVHSGE